jgi:hypothetical protein
MKEAASDELRDWYRSMADDQLLVIAAESSSLTPVAASALREEKARRGLSAGDIEATRASLSEFKEKDDKLRLALFNPRSKLRDSLKFFLVSLLMLVWWGLSALVARAAFDSPQTQIRFEVAACALPAAAYLIWSLSAYLKRRRIKNLANASGRVQGG